jgi:Ni/Co efflux regulator RcnB
MIRLAASTLIVTLTLALGDTALADSPRRGGHDAQRHSDQRWQGRGDHHRGWRDGYDRRGYSHGYRAPRHDPYASHGYYGHRWARGHWLPAEYRTHHYYVPDYRRYGYRVYAPPAGCRWVRHNGDLILTALATGLVLDVIYGAYDY